MKARSPRHGSMQFWPHRRAQKETPVVKHYPTVKEATPLGFAGYKVGMTHIQHTETNKNSPRKGEIVSTPVTIIECPPLHVVGVRTYIEKLHNRQPHQTIIIPKFPKHLDRSLHKPSKSNDVNKLETENITDVVLLVATQPAQTTIGKKSPDVFELAIGGSLDEKLTVAKEKFGKEITIHDVFKPGELVDVHAITKGKGFSGAIARFGIKRRSHKSEKGIRTAGSLGSWKGQGHMMYRVPNPGKHGYYKRITYNQPLLHIGDKPEDVNAQGGFLRYGNVKSSYALIKGSVHGPSKRLIRFIKPIRAHKKQATAPSISYISTQSHQG